MNSANGMVREPWRERNSTIASHAESTGSASPAGEHVPRLPPIDPAAKFAVSASLHEDDLGSSQITD
jgi:hypothetical protein